MDDFELPENMMVFNDGYNSRWICNICGLESSKIALPKIVYAWAREHGKTHG